MSAPIALPKWAERFLVPALSVTTAFLVAGLVVLAIGENPAKALRSLLIGALGTPEGLGFTLFYATNFIFTGLAVAVAFHAGLFNIGGEGQALVGGIGLALVCLALDPYLPRIVLLPAAIAGAAFFGAAWAFVPGYLQAKRGSHVVITTIMFNFLASTLLVYLLVNVMGKAGSMQPETRNFSPAAKMPAVHDIFAALGMPMAQTPLNLSLLLALFCAWLVWLLLFRSRLGFAIRAVGANPDAARYAGLSPERITMITMAISGALASGLAVNELLGFQGKLLLEFSSGYGFVGIAVALMGRAHPAGIVLSAILFGILYQGGAELAFDSPAITRDMITVIGGIIIFFAGALEGLFRRSAARLLRLGRAPQTAGA